MPDHLRLDLVGGLAGDMFIGALLDAFPEYVDGLEAVIAQAGFPDLVTLTFAPHNDGVLTGSKFDVAAVVKENHHHRHFSEIKAKLEASNLAAPTRQTALDIFTLIAEVEAAIHGKPVADIAFHEVGAWDSIADVVIAAHLITSIAADSWSVSSVPLGRGFVKTAHGRLPVPAPATARLLEGFTVHDDGIDGERVTPTGAAILKYLNPTQKVPSGHSLHTTGYGFGTKVFPGMSNVVRVTRLKAASSAPDWQTDEVTQLAFEIDDQSPESLGAAVRRLREHEGVLDVRHQPYQGKKDRQGVALVILLKPQVADAVTRLCFSLTTTLGVRREQLSRAILPRRTVSVEVGGTQYRVKVVRRPDGLTAKVEMDDLAAADLNNAAENAVRLEAEALAIAQVGDL